jgi:large subunit ribosomal protein L9e
VKVKGPKGEITKSFKHMPVEMKIVKQHGKKRKGLYLNIKMWFGGSKQSCSVATLRSLIKNMISGVISVRNLFSWRLKSAQGHGILSLASNY